MDIIEKALQYAINAHKGQFRKDNKTPYVIHPVRVMLRVTEYGGTAEMICAAFLHDVLEDCKDVEKDDIEKEFGKKIADYVEQLTNISKKLGITPRKNRKEFDRKRLSTAPKEIKIIKMFDRIDNLLDMANGFDDKFIELYLEESSLLLEVIKDADEKVANELKNLIDKIKNDRK